VCLCALLMGEANGAAALCLLAGACGQRGTHQTCAPESSCLLRPFAGLPWVVAAACLALFSLQAFACVLPRCCLAAAWCVSFLLPPLLRFACQALVCAFPPALCCGFRFLRVILVTVLRVPAWFSLGCAVCLLWAAPGSCWPACRFSWSALLSSEWPRVRACICGPPCN
jgi:hypothetical protein